jgi:hypothetical protein
MSEKLSLGPHDSLEIRSSTAEALEVEASYRAGGSPRELEAGGEIEIGRGQVHQMWNPGSEPARVRWVTSPGARREVDFGALLEEYGDVFRLEQ